MKKKILASLLVLCLILTVCAPASAAAAPKQVYTYSFTPGSAQPAEEQTGNVTWTLTDGLLVISGQGAMENYAEGEAPWLDEEVFSLVIQDSVTELGSNAFRGMEQLQDAVIGRGVTNIDKTAFNDCPVLSNIVFLGDDHIIPAGTFANCPRLGIFRFAGDQPELEAGSLATGYQGVSYDIITVQYDSSNETWADKKNSPFDPVDPIEYYAYQNHLGASGTCGDDLTWQIVLSDISYLSHYLVITGTGAMYDYAEGEAPWLDYIEKKSHRIRGLFLSSGITYIGENAFDGMLISTASFPGSVREIGAGAFRDNASLNHAVLRENIRYVGDEAFQNCDLRSLSFTSRTEFGTGVYEKNINLPTADLPEGMTAIPDRMFADCNELREITLPTSLTSVGTEAFSGCSQLNTVNYCGTTKQWDAIEIGNGNEPLLNARLEGVLTTSGTCGENALWELSEDFTTLTISGTGAVTSHPWANASGLVETIIVGEGITSLCDSAFYGFSVVTDIRLPETLTEIGASCFRSNYLLPRLVLPAGLTSMGEYAFTWCETLESITVPDGITALPSNAFSYCKKLASVELSEDVTSIGSMAFAQCESLSEINVPSTITELGSKAFLACKSLTHFEWPAAITTVGTALQHSGITELMLPETVTRIGNYAFDGCTELERITIPDSVTSFGEYAFRSTTSLTGVHIPDGLTSIPYGAFSHSGLKSITIPGSVTTLGRDAFNSCSNLTEIVIPDSVTSAESYAFAYCSGLKDVTIGSGLKNISWGMFTGCGITQLEIPYGITDIEAYGFSGCQDLERLVIPPTVTRIDYSAIDPDTLDLICGQDNTYAQRFAQNREIPYEILPDSGTEPVYDVPLYVGGFGQASVSAASTYPYRYITIDAIPDEGSMLATLKVYYYSDEELNFEIEQISDTQYRFLMPDCPVEVAVIFFIEENPFTDVPEDSYYFGPAIWAYNFGITSGKTATTFAPDDDCTRGQVVTFLWRAAGEPAPVSSVNPFTDVAEDDYYYDAVLWAVENGITNGLNATEFGPDKTCTRGQVVTFLWRAAGEPAHASGVNPFTDVTEADYYYDAVLWAVENEITNGLNATEFGPAKTCTRGQVVTFLYRCYKDA